MDLRCRLPLFTVAQKKEETFVLVLLLTYFYSCWQCPWWAQAWKYLPAFLANGFVYVQILQAEKLPETAAFWIILNKGKGAGCAQGRVPNANKYH